MKLGTIHLQYLTEMCNLAKYNKTNLEERNIQNDFNKRWLYHNEKITINCLDDHEYKIGSRPKSRTFTCDDGKIDIGECRSEYNNTNLNWDLFRSWQYFSR